MAETDREAVRERVGKGGGKKTEEDHRHKGQIAVGRRPTSRRAHGIPGTSDKQPSRSRTKIASYQLSGLVARQFSGWSPAGLARATGERDTSHPSQRFLRDTLDAVSALNARPSQRDGSSVLREKPVVGATYHLRPRARRESY